MVHVLDETSVRPGAAPPPDWVADWWMPAGDAAAPAVADDDMAALMAPEPVVQIEVAGRLPEVAAAS